MTACPCERRGWGEEHRKPYDRLRPRAHRAPDREARNYRHQYTGQDQGNRPLPDFESRNSHGFRCRSDGRRRFLVQCDTRLADVPKPLPRIALQAPLQEVSQRRRDVGGERRPIDLFHQH